MVTNYITDVEDPIRIDLVKREFSFGENFNKEIAIQGDCQSNELTFVCSDTLEGKSLFNPDTITIYILWELVNNPTINGRYSAIERTRNQDKKEITFAWPIDSTMTQVAGPIKFSVSFVQHGSTSEYIWYRWSTKPNTELSIGAGVKNTELDNKKTTHPSEESINTLADPSDFLDIIDKEDAIVLNMFNRNIVLSDGTNSQIAIVGDHCSNCITFKIDRYKCDYNIAEADLACIKWIKNSKEDYDNISLVSVDEDFAIYKWVVPATLTSASGRFVFALTFMTAGEADGNGVRPIISKWNTNPCSALSIGEGVANGTLDGLETINPFTDKYDVILEDDLNGIFNRVFKEV